MRTLKISMLALISGSLVVAGPALAQRAGAPKNVPTPPPQVCYQLDDYSDTDFLILSINPGQRIVNGVYRFEIGGGTGTPPKGPAHALLAGTIQDVLPPNTLPNITQTQPRALNGLTQISLTGSVSSGIWNTFSPQIAHCWMHLAFEDDTMQGGMLFGGCDTTDLRNLSEKISRVPCDSIPVPAY